MLNCLTQPYHGKVYSFRNQSVLTNTRDDLLMTFRKIVQMTVLLIILLAICFDATNNTICNEGIAYISNRVSQMILMLKITGSFYTDSNFKVTFLITVSCRLCH